MQPSTFDLYESPSQLLVRRVLLLGGLGLAGLVGVALCGAAGGFGAAATALVFLGFAAVLLLFIVWMGIVPIFDAKPIGRVTVEGTVVRDSRTGRAIDFAQPHSVAVLCSPRVVRTRFQGRYGEYEQSLAYDWVAFVFEQAGTRLTFAQSEASATYDSGPDHKERRLNRSYLGRTPTAHPSRPSDGAPVDMTRFEDFERALSRAMSEGSRASLTRR